MNKIKWVKWLPVVSELNEKLSENSKAAEDLLREKGAVVLPQSAGSVSRCTCLRRTLDAGHVLRGMLLNSGFLKTLSDS